jgi:serine/threonine-protein kinase
MSDGDDELVARAEARLGTVLRGKYRLDRVLGIGGMATVYLATHRNGNEFAVKVLHPDLSLRAEIRNRFLREGHAAGSVKHPGAVQVLDDDVAEDGAAFLVMELLRGESIEVLWERRQQRLPLKLVVGIGIQILDVLDAAHARGVIHRDIKPANIFLTSTGQVKVLDFGIARIRDMAASQATQTGMMLGTPAFMAPEQAMAKTSEIDSQTDVWSAGATMFTLVSGKLVHEAENAQQIMIRAATTPAPAFSSVVSDASPLIAEVIDRALAFNKSERWGSAGAMREALRGAAKSEFGTAPTAETLAEIIEELGEEATVVVQSPLAAEHRPAQLGVFGPGSEAVTTPTARSDSKPVITQRLPATPIPGAASPRRAPGPELATAKPVSSDTPRRPAPLASLRSPLGIGLIAFGAAAVLGTLIGITIVFVRPSRSASPTPSGQAAISLTSQPSAPPPSGPAPNEGPAAPVAPTASVQEVPIDELPTAAATTAPAPPTRQAPTVPTATAPTNPVPVPARPNCNPPYTFDSQGNRKWKRECVR